VKKIKKLKQFEAIEATGEDLKRSSMIENILWNELEAYTSNQKDVVITSAILIKIALSLYTVILKDDKDVEKITQAAINTIPKLRAIMERELNSPTTLH
jgi:hypothetical protein|tara:strand:- start:707 stop:1003 length:297 start_codon:yes stop_codon:yes gene_type:complete